MCCFHMFFNGSLGTLTCILAKKIQTCQTEYDNIHCYTSIMIDI